MESYAFALHFSQGGFFDGFSLLATVNSQFLTRINGDEANLQKLKDDTVVATNLRWVSYPH